MDACGVEVNTINKLSAPRMKKIYVKLKKRTGSIGQLMQLGYLRFKGGKCGLEFFMLYCTIRLMFFFFSFFSVLDKQLEPTYWQVSASSLLSMAGTVLQPRRKRYYF